jgi:hypothetical protein
MAQTVQGKLLAAATATGDGPVFDNIVPMTIGSFQLEYSGAPSRVAVTVQGLIGDSATWGTLLSIDTLQGAQNGQIFSLNFPVAVRQLKANLGTLTGGSSPSVNLHFAARV